MHFPLDESSDYLFGQLSSDTLAMILWKEVEDINLPSIAGVVRTLWSSHSHTYEVSGIILSDINALTPLGRSAQFTQRACPIAFGFLVGEPHQALLRDMIAMCAAITIHNHSCHRGRITLLRFTDYRP